MRILTDAGETIVIGTTEAEPTIGIVDYSRRATDAFGVTTVVKRNFSRRMSVRVAVPSDQVDVLQRRLAALRATPVTWIADDRFASLTVRGFFKDLEFDLAVPPLSFCTLTVESIAGGDVPADAGGDPAPAGAPSTLQLLQPVTIAGAALVSSSVAENDAPAWAAATTYAKGARVISVATHRIYENLVAGNKGNDPTAAGGTWLDVGPTNRWAMFDDALGTSTSSTASIVVRLDAGAANAVALLDVQGATVRVQATGYDRTQPVGEGAITFLDLPANAGQITVTIAGAATKSVGTLLVGRLVALGVTEASPTAGITDYSRKEVDDFGEVTIVERPFAKRMAARALIDTAGVDLIANRLAAVRARPCLWIGQAGLDSLTIYGFFKDFSISVGQTVSKLSLSVEGLSTAGELKPLGSAVNWSDIADPDGKKPADNATEGAPNGTKVGGKPVEDLIDAVTDGNGNLIPASGLLFEIDDLRAVYGTTVNANAAKDAAQDAQLAAEAASANTQAALAASQAARDAAQGARDQAADFRTQAQTAKTLSEAAKALAETARGDAQSALGAANAARDVAVANATTSGTNASNAAASAVAAQSTYGAVVRLGRNSDFDQGAEGWLTNVANANPALNGWIPMASFGGRPNVLRQRVVGQSHLYADYLVPILPDRSYQFETSFFVENGTGVVVMYLGFQCYDINGNTIGGNAGHIYWAGGLSVAAGSGWNDRKSTVWKGNTTFPAGTVAIRPMGLYNYQANTGVGFGAFDYIRVIDVTESDKAAGSAIAAATSASAASTSADAAEQKASAANTSAVTAATKAGEASTSAINAASSATNAAGSASTATTQAGLAAGSATAAGGSATAAGNSATTASTKATEASNSASAANASSISASSSALGAATAAASVFPSNFLEGDTFWTELLGAPSAPQRPNNWTIVNDPTHGRLLRVTNPILNQQLRTRSLLAPTPGRRYRLEVTARIAAYNGTSPVQLILTAYGLNATYNSIYYSGYLKDINPGTTNASAAYTANTGFFTIYLEFTVVDEPNAAWIAPSTYIANAGAVSPNNVTVEYKSFVVRDITEQAKAAGSAAAAATSASTADTKATEAGLSASAASSSATTASTKATEAGTYANNASNSASGAAGSASSASSSAGVAASARDAAQLASRATYPDNFLDPNNWTGWGSWGGSASFNGTNAITTAGGSVLSMFTVPLVAGETYRITARHRVTSAGASQTFLGIATNNGGAVWGISSKPSAAVNVWETTVAELTAAQILAADPNATSIRPGILIGYNRLANGEVSSIKIETVTATKQAEASATAAAGSAASASASSTTAGQQATAAQGSATTASTKAGEASSSASNAATSASTALGHANSAASSASLAATTYYKTVLVDGNPNFDQGLEGWGISGPGVISATAVNRQNVLTSPAGVQVNIESSKAYPINNAAQKFRLRAGFAVGGSTTSLMYLGITFYDSAGNYIQATDGTGNYVLTQGTTLNPATSGWFERWAIIGKEPTGLAVGGNPGFVTGTLLIPAAAASFKLFGLLNYGAKAGAVNYLDFFTVEDVTSEIAGLGYANASASSASSAAASKQGADEASSAASSAKTAAETARGQAQTYASNASTSASNAAGSANTATAQATLASTTYQASVRLTRNDNFEFGTTAWRNSATGGANSADTAWRAATNWAGRPYAVVQRVPGGAQLYADYLVPLLPDRSYRVEASFFIENGSGNAQMYIGFQMMDAAGSPTSSNTGHYYTLSGNSFPAGSGWVTHTSPPFTTANLAAGTTQIRPLVLYNYQNNANIGVGGVAYLRIIDITESQLAAGSASAAATSATTAGTKATEAGNSASAANQSRIDAAAANTNANSAASQAAQSAVLADQKASAASASSSLAASYTDKIIANDIDYEMDMAVPPAAQWSSHYNGINGVNPAFTKSLAWDNVSTLYLPRTAGSVSFFSKKTIQVDPTRTYRMSTRVGAYFTGATGVQTRMYIGFVGLDAAGNMVDHGSFGSYRYSAMTGVLIPDGTITATSVEITGSGNDSWLKFPPGTKQIRLMGILNENGSTNHSYVDYIRFEDVTQEKLAQAQAGIATAQAAQASSQAAAAQTSAVLAASLGTGSLLANATFADYPGSFPPPKWVIWGGTGGRTYGNGDPSTPGISIEGSPWGFYSAAAAAAGVGIYQEVPSSGGRFEVSATVQLRGGTGFSGAGVLVYGLNGNGDVIASGVINFATDPDLSGTVWGRAAGAGTTIFRWSKQIEVINPAVVTIRVYAMTDWSGFDGLMAAKTMSWLRCSIKAAEGTNRMSGIDARISTVESVSATANAAMASRASALESRAGSLESRTTITEQTTADLASKSAAARIQLLASTPGGRASVTIRSDTNNGAGVDIEGDVTFKGKVMFNNGTIMFVQGLGFGSSNQFIEWLGPAKANLNQCTEAEAIRYVRTDGSAYFRGTFLAGSLRSSNANPGVGQNITADTGLISSNGGAIVAQASWDYTWTQVFDYPATTQGAQNFDSAAAANGATDRGGNNWQGMQSPTLGSNSLAIQKDGATVASVSTTTGTRTTAGWRPIPGDSPGRLTVTTTMALSTTYSDPERSTRQRAFRAVLTRGYLNVPTSQFVGITTVE